MPDSAGPTVNFREQFVAFIEEYTGVDDKVAAAVGARKDLRARIKGAGFGLKAFDRARAEAKKNDEDREADDREFRRNMGWMGKPVGFQPSLSVVDGEQPAEAASAPRGRRRRAPGAEGNGHATPRRRGRPVRSQEALDLARDHLGGTEPAGAA